MELTCKHCGAINTFKQPYVYHAGFADTCFLYNETGNLTLVWSIVDPAFLALVGLLRPDTWTRKVRSRFEALLTDAPSGGRWRFKNPARCADCGSAISKPVTHTTAYLVYDGSVELDDWQNGNGLAHVLLAQSR